MAGNACGASADSYQNKVRIKRQPCGCLVRRDRWSLQAAQLFGSVNREVGQDAIGPARLKASSDSIITASWSSQPLAAAALSMAYSPLTW